VPVGQIGKGIEKAEKPSKRCMQHVRCRASSPEVRRIRRAEVSDGYAYENRNSYYAQYNFRNQSGSKCRGSSAANLAYL